MKKIVSIFLVLMLASSTAFGATQPGYKQSTKLLTSVSTVSTGDAYVFPMGAGLRTHQAVLEGASATDATVIVSGSNDGVNWTPMGTLILTTATKTNGFVSQAPWIFERAQVTSISGTGAAVTLIVGD